MADSRSPTGTGGRSPPNTPSTFELQDIAVDSDDLVAYEPPPPPVRAFIHTTIGGVSSSADNIEFPWYWSRLDHPHLNGNPNAVISVTPRGRLLVNHDTHTTSMQHNPHTVGIVYRDGPQRWYIYNLNLEAMARASFNVVIEERYR